ncbi:MAG: hypothetical protein M1834_009508 [Cirrosporium novae-zelandiae]|nr:MAG: hypothetical protein M1834_009508 [Cirrosporium novae-zelandiae]
MSSPIGGLGPTVIAVMTVETAVTLFFLGLRLYTRVKFVNGLGWDDHILIISWINLALYSALCVTAATHGMGRHAYDLTISQQARSNKFEIIGQTFCILGIWTSKSALCAFLLRIVVRKWQTITLWFIIVTLGILSFLVALFDFIQCSPVAAVWNPTIPHTCWMSITNISIGFGAYAVCIDFFLAAFPWHILWKLNMKRKEKLTIGFSLSLGAIAGVCGIIRTIELEGLNARDDYTYGTVSLILWSSSELMVSVVCVCLTALRPFWQRYILRMRSTEDGLEVSSGPYSKRNKYSNSYPLGSVPRNGGFAHSSHKSRNQTVIEHSTTGQDGFRTDNQSDESILGPEYRANGIKRTTDVVVTSDRASTSS